MNKKQLDKLRIKEFPQELTDIFTPHEEEDEFGYYSTGLFRYKSKSVFVNIENGKWHLSADARRTLSYYELKDLRYRFMPNRISVAQIFPPRDEFVNINETCFHLWEVSPDDSPAESILALVSGVERAKSVLKASLENPKNADQNMEYFRGKYIAYDEVSGVISQIFFPKRS